MNDCFRNPGFFAAVVFFSFIGLLSTIGFADEVENKYVPSESPSTLSHEENQSLSLLKILDAIEEIEEDINHSTKELNSKNSESLKSEINSRIESQLVKLEDLKRNFAEIASGEEFEDAELTSETAQIDWTHELEELFSPLVRELKRATDRPRALDRLRRSKDSLETRLEQVDTALGRLNLLNSKSKKPRLQSEIKELISDWEERRTGLLADQSITDQKIRQYDSEKGTWEKSIRDLPDLFFKSRGRNFVLALLISGSFWWILRYSFTYLTNASWISKPDRVGFRRTVNLSYLMLSAFGASAVFLLTLFFLGDWVLVMITVMLVLGLLWTSKQALPQFWAQGALLLNIGPVREGERLEYLGIPWRVQRVNLYTILFNPLLSPSTIRVPLADLLSLRSRSNGIGEPWFPAKPGDWILLEGKDLAEVKTQSPSVVELRLLGGMKKIIPASSFIEQGFVNLSDGFRVRSVFGVDYEHQASVTDEIRTILETSLIKAVKEILGEKVFSLSVQFNEAGASSLDYSILLDCSGQCAKDYHLLGRRLQAACVNAANINGWVIPFNQMTLHLAGDTGGIANVGIDDGRALS